MEVSIRCVLSNVFFIPSPCIPRFVVVQILNKRFDISEYRNSNDYFFVYRYRYLLRNSILVRYPTLYGRLLLLEVGIISYNVIPDVSFDVIPI